MMTSHRCRNYSLITSVAFDLFTCSVLPKKSEAHPDDASCPTSKSGCGIENLL